jgi:hypothetical protein
MFIDMEDIEENQKKYLQLGQIERSLCLQFRQQVVKRKFKQVELLRLLIEWWISLDEISQRNFYYEDFDEAAKIVAAAAGDTLKKKQKQSRRLSKSG